MKIALFADNFYPEISGVSVSLWERLSRLDLAHKALVFCPDYSPVSELYPDWHSFIGKIFPNVEIIPLPSKQFIQFKEHRTLKWLPFSLIKTYLDHFKPDVIVTEGIERLYFGSSLMLRDLGLKYALKNNIPSVAAYHTNFLAYKDYYSKYNPFMSSPIGSYLFKFIFQRAYNRYDFILAASKTSLNQALSWGIRHVCYTNFLGIDHQKYHPDKQNNSIIQKMTSIQKTTDKVVLLSVCRFTPDKGWAFLLKAFYELNQAINMDNVIVIIVGYGMLEKELKQGLSFLKNIVFTGTMSHAGDLAALYASSDIFFSGSEIETKGLAILEASASGIPSLAPNSGAVVEAIENGGSGFLYEPGNTKDFVDKLSLLIKDSTLRKKLGLRARQIAEQNSWDAALQNWLTFLSNICKG